MHKSRLCLRTLLWLFLFGVSPGSDAFAQLVVLDNGAVRREIEIADNHILGRKYLLHASGTHYIHPASREFSLRANGVDYSGQSNWVDIRTRDTLATDGGRGVIVSFRNPEQTMGIELIYLTYPDLPLVRKYITIYNKGAADLKIEAVDVENLSLNQDPTEAWVQRQYARHQWLGPYVGNWDDPLIVVHDHADRRGMAVGNEAIGILKRTSVFTDGTTLTVGLTHPEQDYPFRRWLRPGERWRSPGVFTALYGHCSDPHRVVNTTVQDFVRKYMGVRIEQIPRKPMFVYNTWHPFKRDIDEAMVRELAEAAAECGVEEFVIDDGWQLNLHSPTDTPEYQGDWTIDRKKFPHGLKPVFDYIKSLGMKPGLWISLACADPSSIVYHEHPEWFVQNADGQPTDLHNLSAQSRTGCMATDWYDYIKGKILGLVREHGLAYVKLDLAIVASAYVYDVKRTGCYADNHPRHRDRAESFDVIYERCMALFDELHREAPELFIDCTFETAGKLQLMDYGIALHAEGNWLSNITQGAPTGSLRMRNLAWGRSPALPPASLVIGNLRMDEPAHELNFLSLTGSLPIMLGDPRKLSPAERARYKAWTTWLKGLEARHGYMSFRQDLPGFGEPAEGMWDGFCRVNSDSGSGGLVGIFNQGSPEKSRIVTVPYLLPDVPYQVKQGFEGKRIAVMSGRELAEKGFRVALNQPYDGELYEITRMR
jgi:alpha-galactosidase